MHRPNLVLSASTPSGPSPLEAAPHRGQLVDGRRPVRRRLPQRGRLRCPDRQVQHAVVKPFEVSSYTYLAAGDQAQTNTGFCMWNDATKRAEFTEVEQGSEAGSSTRATVAT